MVRQVKPISTARESKLADAGEIHHKDKTSTTKGGLGHWDLDVGH
jgi:hypothetical protein